MVVLFLFADIFTDRWLQGGRPQDFVSNDDARSETTESEKGRLLEQRQIVCFFISKSDSLLYSDMIKSLGLRSLPSYNNPADQIVRASLPEQRAGMESSTSLVLILPSCLARRPDVNNAACA